jgi:hypothetical protein
MKSLILLLLPIALISLCSYLPGIELPSFLGQNVQVAGIDSGSPDLYLNVQTTSSDIKGGRDVQVIFELRNKQPYDLNNVELKVYDYPCFGSTSSDEFHMCSTCPTNCSSGGTLRANQTCIWSWRWTSDTSEVDRDCSIKFLTTYTAENSAYQDIVILPETEYLQRQVDGTLSNIPIHSNSPAGPLQIGLTFSEQQPFIAGGKGYDMYINYNNVGNGFLGDMNNNIRLTSTDNIDLTCKDYSGGGVSSTLTLNKNLDFINGRSVPTICNFSTLSTPTISIRSLSIGFDYTYNLYNSFSITVRSSGIPSKTYGSGTGSGTGTGTGSGSSGSGCLIQGTKILTPDGFRGIENINTGDYVIGYKDGKRIEAKVLGKSIHFGFWKIYYYKGSWFTEHHRVFPSLDGEAISVVLLSNETKTYEGYVYNIETETKNYFGENDLLIHNVKVVG